ncbi:hypothetical protein [Terrabacter carboxydivorans]|uniref:Uncharacterized protein n=1 Tax=Terrabacter carboxydivorans TaxID=619730 RepID=A0ABP5ZGQ9_9MICO
MTDWPTRWRAVIASDVSTRDGIGWEFTSPTGEDVWAVFREDSGHFPVFSSTRGPGDLPPFSDLEAMTQTAVKDLLAAVNLEDDVGWLSANISAALLMASCEVLDWEGEEWALESADGDEPLAWASPGDSRTPFAWVRARGRDRETIVGVYQDDAVFGLSFLPLRSAPQLPKAAAGSLRPRSDIDLIRGRITHVEVAYDTLVEGRSGPGLVTEVLLHGEDSSTLLIAAEAYSRKEWHLYDESVVALRDLDAANSLDWIPPRRRWQPTHGFMP